MALSGPSVMFQSDYIYVNIFTFVGFLMTYDFFRAVLRSIQAVWAGIYFCRSFPVKFLQRLKDAVHSSGALIIADEESLSVLPLPECDAPFISGCF